MATQKYNLSFTFLKYFLRSPLHAILLKQAPYETTADQYFNLAAEIAIQEPDKFATQYHIHIPDPKTKSIKATKLWKEDQAKYGEGNVLTQAEHDRIATMCEHFHNNDKLNFIYSEGEAQHDFKWTVNGVQCRGFADWLSHSIPAIVDIKIVNDASDDAINMVVKKQLYHVQAAMYRHAAIFERIEVEYSILAFVESRYPYQTNAISLSDTYLEIGHEIYLEQLYKYKKCLDAGNFPGYGPGIKTLEPPNYLMRRHLESEYE